MNKKTHTQFDQWLKLAQYDLKTAKTMLNGKRWLYVAFMCQQAVEKLVKGLYLINIQKEPPRIHDIKIIFEYFEDKLTTTIPPDIFPLFDELTLFYINNRYPEYKELLFQQIKSKKAEELLIRTNKVFKWLMTLIP
ncbi:MAG: HEPN domain-containing protein [Holophagaceae bacterium]|nr:HEPN domain-containing protein [Holophagaceae bacterium]